MFEVDAEQSTDALDALVEDTEAVARPHFEEEEEPEPQPKKSGDEDEEELPPLVVIPVDKRQFHERRTTQKLEYTLVHAIKPEYLEPLVIVKRRDEETGQHVPVGPAVTNVMAGAKTPRLRVERSSNPASSDNDEEDDEPDDQCPDFLAPEDAQKLSVPGNAHHSLQNNTYARKTSVVEDSSGDDPPES
jgi:hypothetical protein